MERDDGDEVLNEKPHRDFHGATVANFDSAPLARCGSREEVAKKDDGYHVPDEKHRRYLYGATFANFSSATRPRAWRPAAEQLASLSDG